MSEDLYFASYFSFVNINHINSLLLPLSTIFCNKLKIVSNAISVTLPREGYIFSCSSTSFIYATERHCPCKLFCYYCCCCCSDYIQTPNKSNQEFPADRW